MRVTLSVNGVRRDLELDPRRTVLEMLRSDLGLTGAKLSCGIGNCGACTVLLDGHAVYACLLLAVDCDGCAVTTVEALTRDGELHPVQQAFLDCDAVQCAAPLHAARAAGCAGRTCGERGLRASPAVRPAPGNPMSPARLEAMPTTTR